MCGVVIHVHPTEHESNDIVAIIIILWIEYIRVRVCSKKLDTYFQTLKPRKCRGYNLCTQSTWHVKNINSAHDVNALNPPKVVTNISIVVKFEFIECFTHKRNFIHEIFIIFRVSAEECIKFSKFITREALSYQLNDMVSLIYNESRLGLSYTKIEIVQNGTLLCIDLKSLFKKQSEFLEIILIILSIQNIAQ